MDIQDSINVVGIENVTSSQDPVVICLQPEGDAEWSLPVITGSQQLDQEIVTLVQEGAASQSIENVGQNSAINHVEVLPDLLGSVVSNGAVEGENTVATSIVNYQSEDGQIFYITYTLPSSSELDLTADETSVKVSGETGSNEVRQPHSILHVAEDGSTVFLNVGHIISGIDDGPEGADPVDTNNGNADTSGEQRQAVVPKSSKRKFPSAKVRHSFVGSNLCIEEKLQIVDAMLTPVPKHPGRKRDKEESATDIKGVGLSYLCQFCGASFTQEKQYYAHIQVHAGERKWSSTICRDHPEMGNAEGLRQHESSTHIVLRRYICPKCPAAFSRLSQLTGHLQYTHFGDRPHVCQICKKSFYKRCDLRSHLNIHLGISKSICETCGRKFNHVSNLIRHSRIHTGIKPYPCSVCGRRFSQLNGMHQHKTIHQENRDISCGLCPKTFKSYNVMRRHMRYSHEDKLISMGKEAYTALKMKDGAQVRRFYCKLCGESFKYAALLKHHENIHVRENNFHCKFCRKDFISAEDMKTHYCEQRGDVDATPQLILSEYIEQEDQLQNSGIDVQASGDIIIYVTEEDATGLKQVHIEEACIAHEFADVINIPVSGEANQAGCSSNYADSVVLVCKPECETVSHAHLIMNASNVENHEEPECETEEAVSEIPPNTKVSEQQQEHCTGFEKIPAFKEAAAVKENHDNEKNKTKNEKLADDISDLLKLDESDNTTLQKTKKKSKKNKKKKRTFHQSSQKYTKRKTSKDCINISEMVEFVDEEDENGIKTKKKIYKCPECSKKFNKNSNFKQHLGVHYMDYMKHACPSCGQCFAWKSTLNKHIMKMHSETPQPKSSCEFCGREYPFAVQVQEHIKRDHLKQRPHVCPTCNKTFYKKHDLSVHRRTHTKEKPYICGTCSKSFSHLSHILRHERIHNGIRPYKCSDCGREFIQSTSLKAHRQRHVAAAQKRELGSFHSVQEMITEDLEDDNVSALPS